MNRKYEKAQWQRSREVAERIVIQGTLVLETPACFGNGDAESYTDMPLTRDLLTGKALLTGASIAGALRNYLRECELGYNVAERKSGSTHAELLFGHLFKARQETVHSWLMIDDGLEKDAPEELTIELRDGVGIDPETRTADKGMKYDIELLPAGTKFKLTFELWRPENEGKLVSGSLNNPQCSLFDALIFCLHGLQDRRIHLGQRKRRGLGQCTVQDWKIWRFDMNSDKGLCAWLDFDPDANPPYPPHETVLPPAPTFRDNRERFFVSANFKLDSSMLIRAGDPVVDMVHLKSQRDGVLMPILPGTSVAGALRARVLRIAQTVLSHQPNAAKDLVEGMFGSKPQRKGNEELTGSRVLVKETDIKKVNYDLVQSRVKIDRFTGGAFPGALFSQQPLFGRDDTEIEIQLELHKPNDDKKRKNFEAEVGLLLLVLKDLWTSDLPLGGESSVGRGRLIGMNARFEILDKDYLLEQSNDKLKISDSKGRDEHELRNELESYVRKLQEVA